MPFVEAGIVFRIARRECRPHTEGIGNGAVGAASRAGGGTVGALQGFVVDIDAFILVDTNLYSADCRQGTAGGRAGGRIALPVAIVGNADIYGVEAVNGAGCGIVTSGVRFQVV